MTFAVAWSQHYFYLLLQFYENIESNIVNVHVVTNSLNFTMCFSIIQLNILILWPTEFVSRTQQLTKTG